MLEPLCMVTFVPLCILGHNSCFQRPVSFQRVGAYFEKVDYRVFGKSLCTSVVIIIFYYY